jgi:hypothetical protein
VAAAEPQVRDLNTQPQLPYEDNSFDVITNAVSVDYLNKPLEARTHCYIQLPRRRHWRRGAPEAPGQ